MTWPWPCWRLLMSWRFGNRLVIYNYVRSHPWTIGENYCIVLILNKCHVICMPVSCDLHACVMWHHIYMHAMEKLLHSDLKQMSCVKYAHVMWHVTCAYVTAAWPVCVYYMRCHPHSTSISLTDPQSLEDREKQIERRRKAALFIEELRRKRELELEEEKETGLNEDSDEFVGPKRRPLELWMSWLPCGRR